MIQFRSASALPFGSNLGPPVLRPGVVVFANQPRRACGACGGRGSKTEQVRRFETCGRCGGKGGKKSGKVWVPCSGCSGAGGFHRTSNVQVTCRTCGGSGRL